MQRKKSLFKYRRLNGLQQWIIKFFCLLSMIDDIFQQHQGCRYINPYMCYKEESWIHTPFSVRDAVLGCGLFFSHIFKRNANHNSLNCFTTPSMVRTHCLKNSIPEPRKKYTKEISKENFKHFEILIIKDDLTDRWSSKYIVSLCQRVLEECSLLPWEQRVCQKYTEMNS